jgi:hypothetical protein
LRIIGYDVKNEKECHSILQIHFVQSDTTKIINESDKKILLDLMKSINKEDKDLLFLSVFLLKYSGRNFSLAYFFKRPVYSDELV